MSKRLLSRQISDFQFGLGVGPNAINLSPLILLWGAVCDIPAKAGIQSFQSLPVSKNRREIVPF
jgi:hypothetical protein